MTDGDIGDGFCGGKCPVCQSNGIANISVRASFPYP
jgi:hypothetical protein